MFAIQSFGQKGYQTVPDSLVCLTPQQDIFFISQSFTIRELSMSLELKKQELFTSKQENNFLRLEVSENKKTIDLKSKQVSFCQEDNKLLNKKLTNSERGKRLFKTGVIIVASVAIIELGYIGILRIVK